MTMTTTEWRTTSSSLHEGEKSSTDWAIAASTIATVGILSNSLSISYFIRKEKNSLPGKQFLLLNSLDLTMCAASSVTLIWFAIEAADLDSSDVYVGVMAYFKVFLICLCQFLYEGTAFATCILSVCRSIKLWFPFYSINGKLLAFLSATFYLYLGLREMVGLYYTHLNIQDETHMGWDSLRDVVDYLVLVIMSAILSVVAVSNVLCIWTLINRKVAHRNNEGPVRTNRDATITIIIVSSFFLFFNMVDLISAWVEPPPGPAIFNFGEWLAVPLNSALNPVVYFLRKEAMRQHVKNLICRKRRVEPPLHTPQQTEQSRNSAT